MSFTDLATGKEVAYASALLIVRHPEHELHYEVFGDEPLVIELDLGNGFDVTHPDPEDQDTVAEWVASIREQMADAGVDEDDPLYLAVEAQLHKVMDAYQLSDDEDADWDDTPPEMFLCPECKSVTTGEEQDEAEAVLCPVCRRELTEDDITTQEEDDDE
jgi:hypothetical protein